MLCMSDKKLEKWVEEHVTITLDKLSWSDAAKWLDLAENDPIVFFKLGEDAIRLRRKILNLPPPDLDWEIIGLVLELRWKILMARDRIANLPAVPLFDFAGDLFYESAAFRFAKMLYGQEGGQV